MFRSMWIPAFLAFGLVLADGRAVAQQPAEQQVPVVARESCLGLIDPEKVMRSQAFQVIRRDGSAVEGELSSLSEHAIVLQPRAWHSEKVEVPVEEISAVKYWVPGVGKSHMGLGAAIGGALGYLLFYAMADPQNDPDDFFVIPEKDQRQMSGFVGMIFGAGMGALVGASSGGAPVEKEVTCAPLIDEAP